MRTISQILSRLNPERLPLLPPPSYLPGGNTLGAGQDSKSAFDVLATSQNWQEGYQGKAIPIHQQPRIRLGLAVEDMRRHMTDEGWQIFQSLMECGWKLGGRRLDIDETDISKILNDHNPQTVLLQDHREWDTQPRDFRDKSARFINDAALAKREDIFKLTILKDSHQRPHYHREAAERIGCHAWVCYYHPRIVSHLASYVRPQHLIRTYHTLNPNWVPPYTHVGRVGALLSGAISGAYPLRERLFKEAGRIPGLEVKRHPGYHNRGTETHKFLWLLSRYRVAICTSSIYGYALRKIIEATACGCIVLTDLPTDEVLPEIDGNLVRISPHAQTYTISEKIKELVHGYDPERQAHYAERAVAFYDYRGMGRRLNDDIEELRSSY